MTEPVAAGVIFRASNGAILLVRRGNGGDEPGTWSIPGGHLEQDETAEQAARREVHEETGFKFAGTLTETYTAAGFVSFLADWTGEPFPVTICDESTGYVWALPDDMPEPLHPGMAGILRVLAIDSELALAEAMRDGVVGSPQRWGNVTLFDLRITGTGTAWRSAANKGKGEFVYRPPEHYLTDEFVRRCNGLTVLWIHTDAPQLTSEEFKERVIGSIFVPYIKGDEVWGIAKIYDDDAIREMIANQLSTSPGVMLKGNGEDVKITLDDKQQLLIEGKPALLDHLAVVSNGVWDKGGEPVGVSLTNEGIMLTAEEQAKKDAEDRARKDADDKAEQEKKDRAKRDADIDDKLAKMDAGMAKMDAAMGKLDAACAKLDAMAEPTQSLMDKAKRDAEEKAEAEAEAAAKKDAEEKETKAKSEAEERAKLDAERPQFPEAQARADAVYHQLGQQAPRPMDGERLMSYRRRLAAGLQRHSAAFKEIDLSAFSTGDALAVAEKQIFADAVAAAKAPQDLAAGELRQVKTADGAGRMISTFYGSPDACWGPFKMPSRRMSGIRTAH